MANKKEQAPLNRSQKIVKFVKGFLWSVFIAILFGVFVNVIFLRAIRQYTTNNFQVPPAKTVFHEPGSSNRVIRFSSALLFARELQRTQAEPLVCLSDLQPFRISVSRSRKSLG